MERRAAHGVVVALDPTRLTICWPDRGNSCDAVVADVVDDAAGGIMNVLIVSLALSLSAQSVMPCDDGCGASAGGAVIGGAVGALVLGGAATLFSASCVDRQSCLWGADGGAIIGAFVAVPPPSSRASSSAASRAP